MASDHFQKCCAICHIFSNRSDLIQRRGICNQPITGNRTISRLHSCYTTIRAWLTDGTSCIRAQCQISLSCCYGCTGAAWGAAWNMLCIPWISGNTIGRSFRRTSHGKLIHICFSDNDHSCFFKPADHICLILGNKSFQNFWRTGSRFSLYTNVIFDSNGNTGERTGISSVLNALLYLFCSCIGFFFVSIKISVDLVLFCFDLIKNVFHTVQDAYLMLFYLFRKL